MKYVSTRGKKQVAFSECIAEGLASDGGLFVPVKFPKFKLSDFKGANTFPAIAVKTLHPFLDGDKLAKRLPAACKSAFNFPIPLVDLGRDTSLLELFHGPTAAFKDFGARFLAEMLAAIPSKTQRTVLVATSGDTGGAVAAAFYKKRGFKVVILYPKGKISPRQEKQLTAWGANIRALAVRGDFDDCQKLVKAAFASRTLSKKHGLLSANSINVGRLLPQMAYYAAASLWFFRKHGVKPSFIVPSGNLGNAVGALWAKKIGMPIGKIVMAANANKTVPAYLLTGVYKPRATVATLANAMDVGNPSNMERVRALYPKISDLRRDVMSLSVSDAEIKRTIAAGVKRWGQVFDPHTATAVYTREKLGLKHAILVSTAHPAKFDSIVEPLVKKRVPIPKNLAAILKRPSKITTIAPALKELISALAAK